MRTILFTILAIFLAPNAIADNEDSNDTWQTAEPLDPDNSVTGTQSDEDWYQITVAGDRVLIDLTFTHADGNIDVRLYSDNGANGALPSDIWGASQTNTDHEFFDANVIGGFTYYIRVYGGTGGDKGNSYTLTWTEMGADDAFEENDSVVAAAPIPESTVAFGSHTPSDLKDWYSIDAAADGTRLLVSLRFNLVDDFDLSLHTSDGSPLTSSKSDVAGVNEAIDFTVVTAGTYLLNVSSANGEGYAIDWESIAPAATTTTTTTTTTTPTDGGSSGSISLLWLFALMLIGLARRVHR